MSLPVWVSELEFDLRKAGTENKGLFAHCDVNDLAKLATLLYQIERAIEHEETLTRTIHYLPLKHFLHGVLEIADEKKTSTGSVPQLATNVVARA